MKNVKFFYLYRDAGNYKVHGHEVFSNPDHLVFDFIQKEIEKHLIDGEFFEPTHWGVKPISRSAVPSDDYS